MHPVQKERLWGSGLTLTPNLGVGLYKERERVGIRGRVIHPVKRKNVRGWGLTLTTDLDIGLWQGKGRVTPNAREWEGGVECKREGGGVLKVPDLEVDTVDHSAGRLEALKAARWIMHVSLFYNECKTERENERGWVI